MYKCAQKIISIILTSLMLLNILPQGVIAATSEYTYTVTDNKATITKYNGTKSKVTVPSTIGGYQVEAIGNDAFFYNQNVIEVAISDGIKYINDWAFYWCTNLEAVSMPDSILTIGKGSFTDCYNLKRVKLSNNLVSVGISAFSNCHALKSIALPSCTEEIGFKVFENCSSLEKITIPFIGKTVDDTENNYLGYFFGATSYKGTYDNYFYDGNKYNVPSTLKTVILTNAKRVGSGAFYDLEELKSITLNEGITDIKEYAFYNCSSLSKIKMPSSLKTIGNAAFYDCKNLKTATLNEGLLNIGESSFAGCKKLENISLPTTLEGISYETFYNCSSITEITIPLNMSEISYGLFYGCSNLKTINLPSSILLVDDYAFLGCQSLRSVNYNGSVKKRQNIIINDYNELLNNAVWYYKECENHTKSWTVVKKATLTKNGYKYQYCNECATNINEINFTKVNNISLAYTSCSYNKAKRSPKVYVKDSLGKSVPSKYYKITYYGGRKYVGKYNVTVQLSGQYSGTKTLYFTITPPKTTINKLTAIKKGLKVYINKKTSQLSGYQIKWSAYKSFSKYKYKTLSGTSNTYYKISGLSANKVYYVKVRTYKTVNGKRVYSGWSSYKYKRTK